MYKQLRFYLRFTSALLAKYYCLIFLGLVMGTAVSLIAPRLIQVMPFFEPAKRIGIVGRYSLPDLPPFIESQVSIGLTGLTTSGLPVPALAQSWEATDSGKTYIFTLDPNYKWQDGSPIKSYDIKYNFSDAAIEYPDANHIVFRLPNPFVPLPSVVSRPIIHITNLPRKYLGVSSYKIKSYRRNGNLLEQLVLTPVASDQLPDLKYYFYPTQAQARTALKLNLVDSVVDLTDYADLDKWPNLEIVPQVHKDRYVAIFFNTQNPDLTGSSGRSLRYALTYATDKSRWPASRRALGPISSDSWAYNPDIKAYDKDMEKAKQFLKNVDKIPSEITLSVVPAYLEVGEQVKRDWEELGLKVNIQVVPDIPEDYQALIIAQAIPPDPDQYNLWHSTQQSTSLTNLDNPRIDKLLEDGRNKAFDQKERLQIYHDFQKFLLEEDPAIFLFHPETYTITKK